MRVCTRNLPDAFDFGTGARISRNHRRHDRGRQHRTVRHHGHSASHVQAFTPRNLGPGIKSGRITAFAVPQPFRKTIYVGIASGGVWKTSNGGTTSNTITGRIGTQSIGDIAVAPANDPIVWVGTGTIFLKK